MHKRIPFQGSHDPIYLFAVPNLDFLKQMGMKAENMPHYGKSANYIAFLADELQPYIRQAFKGTGTQTIIGESLAGLLSAEILLKRPQLFDNYILISPSLWWGRESLLQDAKRLSANRKDSLKRIYIGAPSKKEDRRMYQDAKQLAKLLQQNPYSEVHFDYLPQETHATALHQAVYNAFKLLYPKTAY